ncbi:MAG TPA: hypothetical protein VF529_08675 [Solirubrobacteraceae bacterium]|jgi:hypothetical protein
MRLALLLLATLCFAAPTARASDGTFTQILCANPDTGRGVVDRNGKLPDGTTNPHNMQWAGVSAALSRCADPVDSSSGVPVTTGAGWTSSSANTGAALRYRAPAELTFAGGVIYRHGTMSGHFGWTLSRNGKWDHIFGTPADERCTWGDGCYTRGNPSIPFGTSNRVRVGAGTTDVNGFDLSVLCDIPSGWSCTADGSQTVRVYGGKLVLQDRSAPVPGSASGSLESDDVLRESEDIDFSASDVGGGLYRVRLLVDGAPRLSSAVHTDGGRCADVNPANGDDYEFAFQQPCRSSASVATSFDTRSLPEGEHAVKVLVEDAGGNATTVLNRRVRIDNVLAPERVADPAIDGVPRRGSGLAVVPGAWDDHGAPGEPSITHVWKRCRVDGSSCSEIPGASGLTLALGPEDVGRRIRVVERASNAEGSGTAESALTDVVTLEDGTLPPDRDGIDNDGDGEIDEPGETGPPTTPPSGGSGSGSGGHTDNPSGFGATKLPAASSSSAAAAGGANGEGASPRARLTVAYTGRTPAARTVRYGGGATAKGRLVDADGRPIRGAIIDVSSIPSVRGAGPVAAQPAVTNDDGAFTYRVGGRAASRTIRFAYRWQRGGEVVADASLVLRVRAVVRLAVRLRGVVVKYAGRVRSGPLPRGGKLVVLQGRVRGGRWQTFASRRATRAGVFRGAYRLKIRRPGVRLQFRARAVAESGWPYLEGKSRVVTRRVK